MGEIRLYAYLPRGIKYDNAPIRKFISGESHNLQDIYFSAPFHNAQCVESSLHNREVRWVAVPSTWEPPSGDCFIQNNMRSLSNRGRRMGEDSNS